MTWSVPGCVITASRFIGQPILDLRYQIRRTVREDLILWWARKTRLAENGA
jgi:hypothetical protein